MIEFPASFATHAARSETGPLETSSTSSPKLSLRLIRRTKPPDAKSEALLPSSLGAFAALAAFAAFAALAALAAFVAFVAFVALVALSARAALGTLPSELSLICLPVMEFFGRTLTI